MYKQFIKKYNALCAVVMLLLLFFCGFGIGLHFENEAKQATTKITVEKIVNTDVEQFEIESLSQVVVQAPRYALTNEETTLIAKTIVCETGGEDVTAGMLVAQCILNACEYDGIRPAEVLERYQYASYDVQATTTAYAIVADVFERGNTITDAPIMFFYSPANMSDGISEWHETQTYELTYGGHKFFSFADEQENK